jgi:hypothetical protein
VIEVDKDSITLQDLSDNLKVDKVHVSLCARWIQGPLSNLTPLEAAIRDTGSYIVEMVLDRNFNPKVPNKKTEWSFLTKWVGHKEPTWQVWKIMRTLGKTHEYLRAGIGRPDMIPKNVSIEEGHEND